MAWKVEREATVVPRVTYETCCRDYVTGFRKRKQQRRKEAVKSLEKLQREQRLEERAEVWSIHRTHTGVVSRTGWSEILKQSQIL